MCRTKNRPGTTVVSSAVAAKVAAAAARVGFTREQTLAIAAAEPRGATVFAGSLKPMAPAKRRSLEFVSYNRKGVTRQA